MNYFSLDVEGSEFQILKTIPFQDVDIKVLDIEIDRAGTIFPGTYEHISKYLDTQGYDFHSQSLMYRRKLFMYIILDIHCIFPYLLLFVTS